MKSELGQRARLHGTAPAIASPTVRRTWATPTHERFLDNAGSIGEGRHEHPLDADLVPQPVGTRI
jgi:hypothetical protein